jgi:hypothetical protein
MAALTEPADVKRVVMIGLPPDEEVVVGIRPSASPLSARR